MSLAWALLAPVYAGVLVGAVRVAAPAFEPTPGARFATEGAKIVAIRPLVVDGQRATVREGLWDGWLSWNLPLLVAALLAVPAWAAAARVRAVLVGVGAMAAFHLANVLVNVVYTQMRPVPGRRPLALSALGEVVVPAASYFFDVAGNGFFALLLFVLLVARLWRPPGPSRAVGRNEACPCGSGMKAKRCCLRRPVTSA